MAGTTEKARRRSSWFLGPNFSLTALKAFSNSAEKSSYADLKHYPSEISISKEPSVTKAPIHEPLFQDAYLSSASEDDVSCASDAEAPASPTFSDEFEFDDIESDYEDEVEIKDASHGYGLAVTVDLPQPSEVARRVSVVVCKPKQVYITPPTSPTSPRKSSVVCPTRVPTEIRSFSRPTSFYGSWRDTSARTSNESFDRSVSDRSDRPVYSSSSSISESSQSSEAVSPTEPAPLPRRSNALKRQSNRLSTNLSRLSLHRARDDYSPYLDSPVSPLSTFSPLSQESNRPNTPSFRPSTPAPMFSRPLTPRAPTLQIPDIPKIDLMPQIPPVPEIPRSHTPALKKKKSSMAEVWFKKNLG